MAGGGGEGSSFLRHYDQLHTKIYIWPTPYATRDLGASSIASKMYERK